MLFSPFPLFSAPVDTTPPVPPSGGVGWADSPWGIAPWGGALSAAPIVPFNLSNVVVVATNCIRVFTSVEMLQQFSTGTHDALNVNNWSVVRSSDGFKYQILLVKAVDITSVDIYVLGSLSNFVTEYTVTAQNVRSVAGQLLSAPTFFAFNGVYVASDLTVSRAAAVDLRNFATPRNPIGGTLIIGTNGDYAEMSGDDFLIKMITRRLTTKTGEFFHAPTYGLGIAIKSIMTPAALLNLRIAIERDVIKEPEVQSAKVGVALQAGVLSVQVIVVSKSTGATLTIPTMQF